LQSPQTALAAQTSAGDITATITISSPATQPSFVFSSEPELPQEEVLSRMLFSKATGGLSPAQALQVAQVASQFSDGGGYVPASLVAFGRSSCSSTNESAAGARLLRIKAMTSNGAGRCQQSYLSQGAQARRPGRP